jgi:hypothetical protein
MWAGKHKDDVEMTVTVTNVEYEHTFLDNVKHINGGRDLKWKTASLGGHNAQCISVYNHHTSRKHIYVYGRYNGNIGLLFVCLFVCFFF